MLMLIPAKGIVIARKTIAKINRVTLTNKEPARFDASVNAIDETAHNIAVTREAISPKNGIGVFIYKKSAS